MRDHEPPEPVLTPRLRVGFGLLALGIGIMFLSGKVLGHPLPVGIAGGITIGIVGLVVVIVEALREPPDGAPAPPPSDSAPDRVAGEPGAQSR